jgi:hypothetical protein
MPYAEIDEGSSRTSVTRIECPADPVRIVTEFFEKALVPA